MRYRELEDSCSITRPLVVLGDRWTLVILKQAFFGVRRFNAFRDALGISPGRLQDRLDRLVEHGLLSKTRPEDGRFAEYRLTAKGMDIYPVLMALRDWGDRYMAPDGQPVIYRHRDCEGEARTELTCDCCRELLTARDVAPELGPGLLNA